MSRRSNAWLVAAVLFLVVNLLGAGAAVAQGELLHGGIHALLLIPGVFLLQLARRKRSPGIARSAADETAALPDGLGDRLTHLEQSIDVVAVEVERIGEGQRFITRLFAEEGARQMPDESRRR